MTIRSMAGQSPMRADLTKNLVGLNPDPCSVERNPTTGDWIRNSVDRSSMTTTAVRYPTKGGSNPHSKTLRADCYLTKAGQNLTTDARSRRPKADRNLTTGAQIRKPRADRYPTKGGRNRSSGGPKRRHSWENRVSLHSNGVRTASNLPLRSRCDLGPDHWVGRYRSAMNQMKKGEAWRQPIGRTEQAHHPLVPTVCDQRPGQDSNLES